MKIKDKDIKKAVDLLKAGKIVAIPTETVYGLAADASNEASVKRIFKIKNRPIGHPLIVHISDVSKLSEWAIDIPRDAYILAEHFCPGPLTFVLKRAPSVLDIVTGGQNTIAIRSPKHPITQEILKKFGGGLAAPSANIFGRTSPTLAEHVQRDLGDKVDFILNGGPCDIGIESTIIDLSEKFPRILRPGMISAEMISKVLGKKVIYKMQEPKSIPKVSGSMPSHYATNAPAVLIAKSRLISFVKEQSRSKKLGVLSRQKDFLNIKSVYWITLPNEPLGFARELYEKMHKLDNLNCDLIVIEKVPDIAEWKGVWDRLSKATK